MESLSYQTQDGLTILRQTTRLKLSEALKPVLEKIDTHQGALFVSNFEYPERYSRWDIGFVLPALEVVSKGRQFWIRALNTNGIKLLSAIAPNLSGHDHLARLEVNEDLIEGVVVPMRKFFTEEERSKQPSVFSVIRAIRDTFAPRLEKGKAPDKDFGLYGAFGFDLVFQFEQIEQKMQRTANTPDCHLFLPTRLIIVDHQKEIAEQLTYQVHTPAGVTSPEDIQGQTYPIQRGVADGVVHCDHAPGEFEKKVELVRQGCQRGDFYEVVLSQSFSTGIDCPPSEIFNTILKANPSPYTFFINLGDQQLIGASPEMYVKIDGRQFETSPISGTVPVGRDPMETADRIRELISSNKDEEELTMCTDVDRNDMSRICLPGTVFLKRRRMIEQYSRLIHTVDQVVGELDPDYDAIDALLCHMWACTVTGSPKPIAMQTIENLENSPREFYSGAVGFLTFDGNLNTGMTLRTVQLKQGMATIRAGATLLFESDPTAEERETRVKAEAFLNAVLGQRATKPKLEVLPRTGEGKTVLFVDNHDSFVHTLANYVRQTGARVVTLRSGFPLEHLDRIKPDLLFISPGPKTPREQGVPDLVGEAVKRNLPCFGVCLGHQGMAEYFGATLKTFDKPFHGKPAMIHHNNQGLFAGFPNPFRAARYHSLYVDRATVPDCLEITAETEDGVIMALRHKTLQIATVQFHPESILALTDQTGIRLIHRVIGELARGN